MPNSKIVPSHVSVLVPSVRKAADHLKQFGFDIGPEDVFESEGTKEIYIEYGKPNSLLLMEAIGPGAYERALKKRGPGVHHFAIDVLDLGGFLESLVGSGWLLHPMSVKSMKQFKTAYLARPGFPGLIEVQQKEKLNESAPFVSEVLVPLDSKLSHLPKSVGLGEIIKAAAGDVQITLGGQIVKLRDLCGPGRN